VCDLETPRIGAPYIYDIGSLRVNVSLGRTLNECFMITYRKEHSVLR